MLPAESLLDQAIAAFQRSDHVEAIRLARQAVEHHPSNGQAWHVLSVVALASGDLPLAEDASRRSLALAPQVALVHAQHANVMESIGDLDAARTTLEHAIRLAPQDARIQWTYCRVCIRLGNPHRQEGLTRARIIAASASKDPAMQVQLGDLLSLADLYQEAITAYRAAARLDPGNYESRLHAGIFHMRRGKTSDAVDAFRAAARAAPDRHEAHYNLALAHSALNQPDPATDAFEAALARDPNNPLLHADLAAHLRDLGELSSSLDHSRTALKLSPTSATAHSGLLFSLLCDDASTPESIAQAHFDWARTHAQPLYPASPTLPPTLPTDRTPDRPLRVGYVSPYFREHAVNFFIEPILRSHDRSRFHVFCYSDLITPDAVTARIRALPLTFRDTGSLTDAQLTALIRSDQIDLLIDLSGHLHGNRLLTFARKPAPLQLTYLGYQATTGLTTIDHRLTDAFADPPPDPPGTTESLHSETLLRLPESFFVYQPDVVAPSITDLPAHRNGHITFGSFNSFAKVSPATMHLWTRLLHAVPTSRLLLLAPNSARLRESVLSYFTRHGITPDRWTLAPRRPRPEYLQLISTVDIALDPLPFLGHTTTCDCIHMGVPVITRLGDSYLRRFGAVASRAVGLHDLVTPTDDAYLTAATNLAADLPRIAQLRSQLRTRLLDSPITQAHTFTQNLEAAYRTAWAELLNR